VIQGDGGTRTASITGAFIALVICLKKMKKDKLIEMLPVKDYVAAISVGILGQDIVLDLDYEKDSKADVDMNVVMTSAGKFIEIQGTAEGEPFSSAQMKKMLLLAESGIKKLIAKQKEILKI